MGFYAVRHTVSTGTYDIGMEGGGTENHRTVVVTEAAPIGTVFRYPLGNDRRRPGRCETGRQARREAHPGETASQDAPGRPIRVPAVS
jgi:hypothetical protein